MLTVFRQNCALTYFIYQVHGSQQHNPFRKPGIDALSGRGVTTATARKKAEWALIHGKMKKRKELSLQSDPEDIVYLEQEFGPLTYLLAVRYTSKDKQ